MESGLRCVVFWEQFWHSDQLLAGEIYKSSVSTESELLLRISLFVITFLWADVMLRYITYLCQTLTYLQQLRVWNTSYHNMSGLFDE